MGNDPLAAVIRALDTAGGMPPAVRAAAHILAAEQLTAECESCACATAPGDLCRGCAARSGRAAGHRLAADELRAACGLVMVA